MNFKLRCSHVPSSIGSRSSDGSYAPYSCTYVSCSSIHVGPNEMETHSNKPRRSCCFQRRESLLLLSSMAGQTGGDQRRENKTKLTRPIKRVDCGRPLYRARRVSYCRKTKHKTSLAFRFIDHHCCRTRRGVNHCVSSLVNIRAPPALARNRVVELNLSNVTSFID